MEKSGFVKEEAVDSWGPTDTQIDMPIIEEKEELNFGICYIRSTKNNTHIHITDITGSETIAISTGGAKVKSQKDEGSSYAAMLAVQDVVEKAKERGINAVHIRMRGKGGVESKIFEVGGQTALRALARNGMKIGTIEDRTPYSTDGTRRASGRRGRRL